VVARRYAIGAGAVIKNGVASPGGVAKITAISALPNKLGCSSRASALQSERTEDSGVKAGRSQVA